ncbi:MAG: SsrA-binding protein SmpB [Anaerolineales bacterium]|nr:SsrA-binding protein SmpB [Anaerolineales bacterium]
MSKVPQANTPGDRVVATNRSAGHSYFLEDRFEAGLALVGSEIKSVRAGQVQLKEAYVQSEGGEMYLLNAHISPYDPASRDNHDPLRPRKLLLHKKEIGKLAAQAKLKGYAIVPLRMYLVKGRAKLEIALGRGKKNFDKRQAIAERDSQRDIQRALSLRGRG